jgi:hypothetical protein
MASEREHASRDFARKEWANWEAKACELQAHVDALTAERDTLAEIVERVREITSLTNAITYQTVGQYRNALLAALTTREGA